MKIAFRWFSRKEKREDYTEGEWRKLCERYLDPEPPLGIIRTLQYRIEAGEWREVPEEYEAKDFTPST